jgi:polysaccharide biosynthesis transport protein
MHYEIDHRFLPGLREKEDVVTADSPYRSAPHHLVHVLRRRKWIVIMALVLVPAFALAYSFHQRALYHASAEVLVNQNGVVQNIAGAGALVQSQDPQRFLDTQAALAREPEVARRVVAEEKQSGLTVDQFLRSSSVNEKQGANLLVFGVTNHHRSSAMSLAATYAQEYVSFERELDSAALKSALAKVQARIRTSRHNSALYASLSDKAQQLETLLTLQTSTASVVRVPDAAKKVQPRPLRNGLIALVLGLIIGLGVALLRDSLDARVRTAREISTETGLPLLARIPTPVRRLSRANRLVMLADPYGAQSESIRALRANIEYAQQQSEARTIMVTSALEREGKSTTSANLAVALTRAGHRVTLVDLDLRRPFLHRFFDHEGQPGVTEVALGQVEIQDAVFEVALPARQSTDRLLSGNGTRRTDRSKAGGAARSQAQAELRPLVVMPAGAVPPDPGEFVATQALADVLTEVRRRSDIVVIDSPPLFHVSDALVLSDTVDAMVLVSRIGLLRHDMIPELHRLLEICPATKLGFVLTGADDEEGSGYAYGYGYGYGHESKRTQSWPLTRASADVPVGQLELRRTGEELGRPT